jgi:PAS domain S-box-containing protein
MTTLLELARATTTSLRLADVLAAAAAAAAERVSDGFALIWLMMGDRLVLRGAAGVLTHAHGGLQTDFAPGEGLIGRVALTRALLFVEEPATDPHACNREFLGREAVRAFVGVPLTARYGFTGVLGVFSRRPGRPDAETLEALGALAAPTALAVESARLFADSERRRRAAEALASVSQALAHSLDPGEVAHLVADNVIALLGARDVVVYRLELPTGNLVSMAFAGEGAAGFSHPMVTEPGIGASGLAVAQRAPVITTEMLNDPRLHYPPAMRAGLARAGYRAGMAVPLLIGGEPIGALGVAASPGRVFDDDARRLLEAFADQAAVALHNARLFAAERAARAGAEAVEHRLRDLLRSVDAVVTEVDIASRQVLLASGRAERLLGYTVEQWMSEPDFWLRHLHPEDLERVTTFSAAEIAAGRDYVHEYRMLSADGRVVWLRDSVTVEGSRLRSLKVDITSRKQAEAALRASEQQYRMLVSNIPDVAWLIDRDGNTLFVSPHVERVSGYADVEICQAGANGWFGRVHPDDRPLVRKRFDALFEAGSTFDLEYRVRHRDGRWIWLHDRAVTTYEQHGVRYAYGLYSDITDRKHAEEIRALLLNQVITVQEEERRRIARELHDETAQSLASLLLGLSGLQKARTLKSARTHARELHQVATHALAEVRRLAWGLRPSVLDDLGLAAALTRYASDFGRTRGIVVEVDTGGLGEGRLSPGIETALYRIMQEALSNVARHAAAQRARVQVNRFGDVVSMVIEDDGRGFAPDHLPPPSTTARGLGIHTMRERAVVLNGTCTVDSTPGRGTRVTVEIPLLGTDR